MKKIVIVLLVVLVILLVGCEPVNQPKMYSITLLDGTIEKICAYSVMYGIGDNYYFLWSDREAIASFPSTATFTAIPVNECK